MKSVGSALSNKLQFLKLEISALVLVFCWIWIQAVAVRIQSVKYVFLNPYKGSSDLSYCT
jgi:hypothetical protein